MSQLDLRARVLLLRDQLPRTAPSERIFSQLLFCLELQDHAGVDVDGPVRAALPILSECAEAHGSITQDAATAAEDALRPLASAAREYTILCVGHAHIDMNWTWGWPETVTITLDTFRTLLNLMGEYPELTFAQSQAAVYKIVADYDPQMLQEIRQHVKAGRWEVTAAEWVEMDKNMSCAESLLRQATHARRYLSDLLDIPADSIDLDYSPDTFGHSRHVPEILTRAGVRYYYHCRGADDHIAYRWQAPSGAELLVYREPTWYNDKIDGALALPVVSSCKQLGIKMFLQVFGIGDHGGGPTRRDLETIRSMSQWPVWPQMRFGSYHEFFRALEAVRDDLPIVKNERNAVFTGCYTTQSRIKMANRAGETALYTTELFATMAAQLAGTDYPARRLVDAWRNVLFNQFHDILPGSGVADTREHALGIFQETMATALAARSRALALLGGQMDTSNWQQDEPPRLQASVSEGAGVGFGIKRHVATQTERGQGWTRIYHTFNSSAQPHTGPVELTLWDWPGDWTRVTAVDAEGRELPVQALDAAPQAYWSHEYLRLLVDMTVPAFGYATVAIKPGNRSALPPQDPGWNSRVHHPETFALENEHLRAEFNPQSFALRSLYDKDAKCEWLDTSTAGALFRYIVEDDRRGMTAWRIGRYGRVTPLDRDARLVNYCAGEGLLRQSLSYSIPFERSTLTVTVSLDAHAKQLNIDVDCEWLEVGRPGDGVPQLNFAVPLADETPSFHYGVPMGTVERPAEDQDLPGSGWIAAPRKKRALMLLARHKYGFRGLPREMSVALLRSSYAPDPYPDLGRHQFALSLALGDAQPPALLQTAHGFEHVVECVSGHIHEGALPPTGTFLQAGPENIVVSAVKMPDDLTEGRRLLVRLYEATGRETQAELRLPFDVEDATIVQPAEHHTEAEAEADGETVRVQVPAYGLVTVACTRRG